VVNSWSLLYDELNLQKLRKEMNFTVYSRDGCPYCSKVVQVLQLSELKHVIYKLGRDFDREGFYSQFGQGSTFPQVTLDGTNLGGCTETVKYLKENNLV
jgi:glutaredoxin|tara:strand:- start:614 stop:910 length:297 start_codon:yes stop_codon:yes gene_type:complete